MTETCRAAVFPGDGTYDVREFRVPDPPPGGALLQVEAVGLCGSDVAQFEGIEIVPGACMLPVVPGHETVGRVVALAADADLGVT
jgi:D-arabinose 1-dehydrogenase-like Zn-dependent alcohol dehydrogenase